jgi:hypothetical protein
MVRAPAPPRLAGLAHMLSLNSLCPLQLIDDQAALLFPVVHRVQHVATLPLVLDFVRRKLLAQASRQNLLKFQPFCLRRRSPLELAHGFLEILDHSLLPLEQALRSLQSLLLCDRFCRRNPRFELLSLLEDFGALRLDGFPLCVNYSERALVMFS